MKGWRLNTVLFFLFVFGAAIISQLFYLQVLNYKFYRSQALGQQAGFKEIKGQRGEIFLQNSQESKGAYASGEIKSLAINKEEWVVSAMPDKITDKDKFAESLGQIISEPKESILSKIEKSDSYVIIKKELAKDEIERVKKSNLKGLYWEDDPARYYPQETLASKTVGFLGGDGTGQYGLEGYYENILMGKTGIEENKRGLGLINDGTNELSLDGSDLYLTIDYNIQFEAESLLKKAKEDINMNSGQIIVIKPDTGRVIAMANFPNFNPNNYSKEKNFDIFQNGTVQKIFEPGSVMKPFTMSAALNEGKITSDTVFEDAGFVKVGIQTISNFDKKKYGKQTMTNVLEKSINTGAVFASQQISHKTFIDYLDRFGFFEKTGIDLQGEVYSINEILKNGQDIAFATASFGQGIEITPLQLIRAFCALANGGKLVKLYVVDKITSGNDEKKTNPELSEQIISQKTVSDISTMLISVVEKGSGKGARIPGYYLAGKTGTAQVPLEGQRGYYADKTIQSFIGFGPVPNPQFVILVKLDNPKASASSLSASPIFKKMAQYIINYWQIPPDYQ